MTLSCLLEVTRRYTITSCSIETVIYESKKKNSKNVSCQVEYVVANVLKINLLNVSYIKDTK